MCKIINRIDDLKVDTFFTPANLDITRNAEHKTNVRKFPFSIRIASAWNALSFIIKSAPNNNKFKNLLDRDQIL